MSITIGPHVGVEVNDPSGASLLPDGSAAKAFFRRIPPVLTLDVRRCRLPAVDIRGAIFESPGHWKVIKNNGTYTLVLYSFRSPDPYQLAIIDFSSGHGEIYLDPASQTDAYPFFYPVDEIVFSKLLADRGGFITHAAGLDWNGRGVLFLGHSGAGKSTIAELFARVEGVEVLSDDRLAIETATNHVTMTGTPWHGLASFASPRTVRLERIYFLRQASSCATWHMTSAEAAARLFALSVVPYWDQEAAERVLSTCAQLSQDVPCAGLEFFPDQTLVEFISDALDFA